MGVRLQYPIIKREPLIVGFKRGYTTVLYEELSRETTRVLYLYTLETVLKLRKYTIIYVIQECGHCHRVSVHFTVTPIL